MFPGYLHKVTISRTTAATATDTILGYPCLAGKFAQNGDYRRWGLG